MYKENFKKRIFSSTWRISVAHGMIQMNLHLACLNVILNILPSCGHINLVLVVFDVGPLLQLALVTTSPSLPYNYPVEMAVSLAWVIDIICQVVR